MSTSISAGIDSLPCFTTFYTIMTTKSHVAITLQERIAPGTPVSEYTTSQTCKKLICMNPVTMENVGEKPEVHTSLLLITH